MTKAPKNVAASVVGSRDRPDADTVLLTGELTLRVWGVPRARPTMDIIEFLMPAAKAAATSAEYPVRWEPLGPWQHGR